MCSGVPKHHAIVQVIEKRRDEATKRAQKQTLETEIRNLENQVKTEIMQGKLDKSVDTLTKIMATRKTLLKTLKALNEDLSPTQVSTAYTLKLFGQVLMEKKDTANAERAFEDSLKLFVKAGEKEGSKEILDIEMYLKKLRSN